MALLESDLQAAIITWAKTLEPQYPELRWLFHVPNGGKRNAREAMNLKAQGVRAGVVDLCLPVAKGGYHGFWLELKKPNSDEKPTDKQTEFMQFLVDGDYFATWTNDFDEAKRYILDYLNA